MARNWLPIVLTSVLIWLPIDLIYSAIDWHLVDYSYGLDGSELPLSPLQGTMIPYLLNLTIGLVGEACLFLIAHRAWFGKSTDFFGLLLPALGAWSRLFRTRILTMLMLGVGFLLILAATAEFELHGRIDVEKRQHLPHLLVR